MGVHWIALQGLVVACSKMLEQVKIAKSKK